MRSYQSLSCDEKMKVRLMSQAWALLVPSEREGWSLSVLEANACGTPAVAFDVGGLSESIVNGVTGIVLPCAGIDAYSDVIGGLLRDAKRRAQLSANARQWSLQFSWDRYYAEMMSVLKD